MQNMGRSLPKSYLNNLTRQLSQKTEEKASVVDMVIYRGLMSGIFDGFLGEGIGVITGVKDGVEKEYTLKNRITFGTFKGLIYEVWGTLFGGAIGFTAPVSPF